MSKVIVTKSKLDDLANSINTKAETTGAKTIDELKETIDGIKTGGSEKYFVSSLSGKSVVCKDLIKTLPIFEIPNTNSTNGMYDGCRNLEYAPLINTVNVTNMSYMHWNCSSLRETPLYDTRNVESFEGWCGNCLKLRTVSLLNLQNCKTTYLMFSCCYNLENISFVKNSICVSISFISSSLLNNESVQSIIDGLADLTEKTAKTLTLHADVKAKLTETQIAEITSKNWNLA